MQLSERQLELVQGAAECLIHNLNLFHDESIRIIAQSLKMEITERNVTFEVLDASPRAERAMFLRAVVQHTRDILQKRGSWRPAEIDRALDCFMEKLHESWMNE